MHGRTRHWLWLPNAGGAYPWDIQIKRAEVLTFLARWPEAEAIYRDGLNVAAAPGFAPFLAEARSLLGGLLRQMGRYDQSMELLTKALAFYEKDGGRLGISRVLGSLGGLYLCRGEHEQARVCYERELVMARQDSDRRRIGHALGNIGSIHYERGEFDRALACYREKLALAEAMGERYTEGIALGNLGNVYAELGDYPAAMDCYRRKLEISTLLGDKEGIGIAVGNLGIIHAEQGRHREAHDCYTKRLEVAEEIGDRRGAAIALCNMGNLYKQTGDRTKAHGCYDRAIAIGQETGIGYLGYFLYDKADLLYSEKRYEQSRALNREALAISEKKGWPDQVFKCRLLGAKLAAAGDKGQGAALVREILNRELSDLQEAEARHELWRIAGDEESRALAIYRARQARAAKDDYRERIEELEGKNRSGEK
ncbi:MAG: tetratricopeptide repeat protein [Candidatus Edwardsbacteria bacterium]|nr:tetratricopeptide repeat protein [Candidatus Edwardsbacteria bacterium]